MKCDKCGEVYSSQYYFKDEGMTNRLLCIKCTNSMTVHDIERFIHEPKPEASEFSNNIVEKIDEFEDEIESYIISKSKVKDRRLTSMRLAIVCFIPCIYFLEIGFSAILIDHLYVDNIAERGGLASLIPRGGPSKSKANTSCLYFVFP
jgi:hypothetical protein